MFFPRSYLLGSDDEKMEFIGMQYALRCACCLVFVGSRGECGVGRKLGGGDRGQETG